MTNSREAAPDAVKNSPEIARGNSVAPTPNSEEPKGKCPILDQVLDPNGPFLSKWSMIFVISTVVAVFLDPLFLYIRIINQDMKCLQENQSLKILAVVWRSIADLVYVMKIILQIYKLKKAMKEIWESCIIVDILAVLPIPQVGILIVFPNLRGSRSLSIRKLMNFLVLFQYVPRLLRVYLACMEYEPSRKENSVGLFITSGKIGLWLKGGLNFLMYILASHVFGAFWYFFSIQRMLDCWQHACQRDNGCKDNTFSCHDHHTNKNITLLTASCPLSPANTTIFDFGIFLGVLESSIAGSKDYSKTLSNCFWWGLKNLSSFGSNLQPSDDTWENLFAASISIIGLLLFLYLIGKLQIYMQNETARVLEQQMKRERTKKIERKMGKEVELWLNKKGLPTNLKVQIMKEVVKQELEENTDVHVDNIHTALSSQLRKRIRDMEDKIQEVNSWLDKYGIPMDKRSEVMDKVREELEADKYTDVEHIISALPPNIQTDIQGRKKKMEDKQQEVHLWLSQNGWPMHKESEIMDEIRRESQAGRDVAVDNILSILSTKLQDYIKDFMRKMEEKSQQVNLWLSKYQVPMYKKSDIILIVRQQLANDRDVDVENIVNILPSELQLYIKNFTWKIGEIDREVEFWLFQNGIPLCRKSEIMETVRKELDKGKDVEVKNILSFLPPQLQRYINKCILDMETKSREVSSWLSRNGIPMHKKLEILGKVKQELREERNVDVENLYLILPKELQSYTQGCRQKMETRFAEVHMWLSKKGFPMHNESEIKEKVRQELVEERDVDVENILSILSPELQSSFESFTQRLEEKTREVHLWLLQKYIPMHTEPAIMEKVHQELREEREVDVENILSILSSELQSYIKSFMSKMKEKDRQVDLWLSENRIPLKTKLEIMVHVRQVVEENNEVDVKDILSILPDEVRSYLESFMQKIKEKDREVERWLSENGIPLHTKSEIMEHVQQALEEGRRIVDMEIILSFILPKELRSYIKGCMRKIEAKGRQVDLWLTRNGWPMNKKSDIMKKVRQELHEGREVDLEDIYFILPSENRSYIKNFLSQMEENGRVVDLWLTNNWLPKHKKEKIMRIIRQELEEHRTIDVQKIHSMLKNIKF